MATGYQGREPSTRFCEIVYVGRKEGGRIIRPHDVTIFYKSTGRGEFEVQGGVIFDSEQGSGQRRLTIVAAQGYKFGIARDRGGTYTFTTSANRIWGEMQERVDL
ncbi:hypothetical protein OS493_024136 [Desmophyllum pertusum]|uniref:Uncharacterized protein n=1 Tax=Desmophyllum pertusum TaxID=174260 RepID=A0A9W9ZDI5_9CNID|nr:hypothetical protein OS493_024136 [Desmophyllum pertusum]